MKTTDKKAFFFDYDGTLWFGSYGQKTLKALKTLKEKGHLVLYNSGRSKANTRFDKIGEIDFDGFLFGGCHLELFGKTLFRSDLTPEQISVALAVEEDFNLRVIYEGVEGVYKKRGVLDWLDGVEQDDIGILRDTKKHPVSKFSVIKQKTENGEYLPIDSRAMQKYAEHFKVIEFNNYLECVQKGLGKSYLAQMVVDELGLKMENVYAFGDSLNDYEMFTWCDNGVAIGHSPEQLKERAIYITKEELDGVYEALVHLGIID